MDYRESTSCVSSDNEFLEVEGELESLDDSEEEFNQIIERCQRKREQNLTQTEDVSKRFPVNITKVFDSEYYNLPKVEDLAIHVDEDINLKKFGVVDKFIDFIVNIKPNKGVPHLDYDTVLFDKDRNSIGEVFEVFGTVEDTMYALRFNSAEEAKLKTFIGQDIYFAPDEKLMTRKVLTTELLKMKISDENDSCDEENLAFSDDEAEAVFLAKKRAKSRPPPPELFRPFSLNKRFRQNNL